MIGYSLFRIHQKSVKLYFLILLSAYCVLLSLLFISNVRLPCDGKNYVRLPGVEDQCSYVQHRMREILRFYRHTLGCEITRSSNVEVLAKLLTSVDSGRYKKEDVSLNFAGDVFLSLRYPEYVQKLPNFINVTDGYLFAKNLEYMKYIGRRNSSYFLHGFINFFRGGISSPLYDCGQNTNLTHFTSSANNLSQWKGDVNMNLTTINLTIVSPLLVPEGNTFQHFLDGVLPKLAQLSPFLRHPNVHFTMFEPGHAIIHVHEFGRGLAVFTLLK